jgi:aminobenzoyl-glutamate transport protein
MVTAPMVDAAGAAVLDGAGKPKMQPVFDSATGRPRVVIESEGEPLTVRNLLSRDGVYWMLSNMVRNFVLFPPLGLVLTSMLGIGLAEKVGLFSAFMRWMASITPRALLTPAIVFLGCNSSITSDAGYVILPPLAAGLYAAMGRSPIAGIAAAFAGVSGGFGAGFFITGADAVLAGVATNAAQIIDGHSQVLVTSNWYFKAGSAVVLTLAGWGVTDLLIEPRLKARALANPPQAAVGQVALAAGRPTGQEMSAMLLAAGSMAAVLGVFMAMALIPGGPLEGVGKPQPTDREAQRWSHVIVPAMFFVFLTPGLVYGIKTGAIRSQRDFCEGIYHAVRQIAPVIAMAFFASQFLEYFKYSNMDRMLAYVGGEALVKADLPAPLLIAAFIVFIILADFALSSMTAKFTALAPIVIPMFMLVGLSPDLTMAAYRIGDSVVNVVSPLNSYLLIVLIVLNRYDVKAGLGSLIALMAPYSIAFGLVWTVFLLAWYMLGVPVGPSAGLHYVPPH